MKETFLNTDNLTSGFILADKPIGLGSTNLVGIARREVGIKKIGHTGTLDRFANGLMLLMVGKATNFSERFLHSDKAYLASFQFGRSTNTHDPSGETLAEQPLATMQNFMQKERDAVHQAIANFKITSKQIPPLYSALKTGGRRYSDLARNGEVALPPPRAIKVYSVEILQYDIERARIEIALRVSGGTYIRSFVRDLGEIFQIPIHLAALRRTELANFKVNDVRVWKVPEKPESDQSAGMEEAASRKPTICDIKTALPDWPILHIHTQEDMQAIAQGRRLLLDGLLEIPLDQDFFIVDSKDCTLAWARRNSRGYEYKRVFI